jgi:DHA2 family multidrug resistance protein
MGYPVVTTGLVLAPRGIGTMLAMMVVGRLVGRVDARALIFAGLAVTALSLWEMAGFTTDVDQWTIVRTGIVQGVGLGLIFVPLSTVTFATLAAELRTEATAMFSLLRNLGSSIGVSIVTALLAQFTQINHATLAEHITPFNPLLQSPALPESLNPATPAGLAALNDAITRQAATIGYLNDFRLMMYVVLAALPLLLLLRKPQRPAVAATAAALD